MAGCVNVLLSHLDVLGARSEKKQLQLQELDNIVNAKLRNLALSVTRETIKSPGDSPSPLQSEMQMGIVSLEVAEMNAKVRTIAISKRSARLEVIDRYREDVSWRLSEAGRVLEVTARPEDETLRLLAQSKSNIAIRWELCRYLGGGAFGCVYMGRDLDTGELMAVKEIKFPELGVPATTGTNNPPGRKKRNAKDAAKANNPWSQCDRGNGSHVEAVSSQYCYLLWH